MTTPQKAKATKQNPEKQSASAKRPERTAPSAMEILTELKEVRAAVESSVAAYAQINAGLNQQNLSIVNIAEAMRDVKAGLERSHHQPQTTGILRPSNSADRELTAEYDADTAVTNSGMKNGDWDDIRAAFLKEHSPEETLAPVVEDEACVTVEPFNRHDVENEELERLLEQLPCAVDPASTDPDELRRAVIDRDRTISVLVRRLQTQNRSRQTLTPEQLAELVDGIPEELARRVEESLQAVNQQVRLGELELSLERARVSRQLAKLEETRDRLESNARSLGLTIAEDGTIEGTSNVLALQGSKGRRWLGVLGFGN